MLGCLDLGAFRSKDVLLEEALSDKIFQVLLEGPAVDNFVSFTIMIGVILFCSEKCEIVLNWSWISNPWLVLDGVEDLINGELQKSEVFLQLVGSEWTW